MHKDGIALFRVYNPGLFILNIIKAEHVGVALTEYICELSSFYIVRRTAWGLATLLERPGESTMHWQTYNLYTTQVD